MSSAVVVMRCEPEAEESLKLMQAGGEVNENNYPPSGVNEQSLVSPFSHPEESDQSQ